MKIKGSKIWAALLCGALMGGVIWQAPGLAEAAPVTFQIDNGTQGGFQYSLIHSADGAPMNVGGVDYYASGAFGPSQYGTQMTGSLSGDMTTVGSLLQWTGITGTLLSNNGSTLTITGGSLSRQTTGSNQNAFGSFSYSLTGPGGASAGVFHFHPNQFTGPPGPNSLTETEFFLWGNNWNNGVEALPGAGRLGIDLHAVAPVPLPGALLFFGSGLMGLLGFRKTCHVI
ncbi:MAG: PEP-CTERM sorting domain-containing protein [Nitrospiraceae bacterium]|nr:PEP-CTERM sorting domain-containing protein [Nitrospiraceae bacterium]OQW65661.1 MAG: hypothetical protein BVN29_08520 [Nitrospira sp. ST-bin5]